MLFFFFFIGDPYPHFSCFTVIPRIIGNEGSRLCPTVCFNCFYPIQYIGNEGCLECCTWAQLDLIEIFRVVYFFHAVYKWPSLNRPFAEIFLDMRICRNNFHGHIHI